MEFMVEMDCEGCVHAIHEKLDSLEGCLYIASLSDAHMHSLKQKTSFEQESNW
jgi:copper chaperone CopZ